MTTALLEELAAGHAPDMVQLTVDQVHEMIRVGILSDGAPIELIEGTLVYKDRGSIGDSQMTHNPRHAAVIQLLTRLLTKWSEAAGSSVRCQLPVTLSASSEPEPDVAIIAGSEESYADRHLGPEDLWAVFEVADSSVKYDRRVKQKLYAIAGIPTYWIINLTDRQVEVYSQPDASLAKYSQHVDYHTGQSVSLSLGGHTFEIEVARLFA
jgi:Uma2 family endonuclease